MQNNRRILTFAALALATVIPAEGPKFAPAAGTKLSRHLELKSDLAVGDVRLFADGTEMDGPPDGWTLTLGSAWKFAVVDTLGALEDGRVVRTERSFTELQRTETAGSEEEDLTERVEYTLASPLQAETVVFTWNSESERYDVAALDEDSDLDEDLLAGLTQDLDFAALLPTGEVEVDATWEVDAAALAPYLSPCGDLGFEIEDEEEEGDSFLAALATTLTPFGVADDCEGTLRATLTAVDTETQRATIRLTGQMNWNADRSELLRERWETLEGTDEDGPEKMTAAFQWEVEGELHWDLARNHMHALKLSGDQTLEASMGGTEEDREVRLDFEFAGTLSLAVTLE
ncbi:MAG: hypothetical protein GC161_08485 [Planctomycetaceae bacterium]|nr:hypothetical protein [Planctomycetaceae bacterium]